MGRAKVEGSRVGRRALAFGVLVVPVAGIVMLARGDGEPTQGRARAASVASAGTTRPGSTAAPGLRPSGEARRARATRPDVGGAGEAARTAAGPGLALTPESTPVVLGPRASGTDVLAALRAARNDDAREVESALLDAPTIPGDPAFVAGLVELARDPRAAATTRVVALELLPHAASAAEPAIEAIRGLAVERAADAEVHTAAVLALRRLLQERPELEAPVRAALLDALDAAPTKEALASGLDGLELARARDADVARVTAWLADADPFVRAAAARALATVPAGLSREPAAALERALERESSPGTAAALGDALAVLTGHEVRESERANASGG